MIRSNGKGGTEFILPNYSGPGNKIPAEVIRFTDI